MKNTAISIIIAGAIIGGSIIIAGGGSAVENVGTANNVTVLDDKQIIEITAKGGYFPRKSVAKSGLPTILRINTNGTFDCSSSVRIPSMNISKILPQFGTTDIDLGIPQVARLQGTCGMGMYPFEIEFQS